MTRRITGSRYLLVAFVKVTEADIAAGCNAAALPSSEDLELCLRKLGGLGHSPLHPPPPRSFARQAEAIRYLEGLLAQGVYRLHQLGLFSREFSSSGCRRFFVDTKVGFALTSAPSSKQCDKVPDKLPQQHLYEVLMETQPCWLYFDLEFARCVNPNLDPGKVFSAFYDLLNEFCFSTFGLTLDTDSVFELDSTTDEKFSKHVIAKRLGGQYHFQSLAFPNNAQAGYFVKKFMDFVRDQRLATLLHRCTVTTPLTSKLSLAAKARRCAARWLFARAKPKKQKENQKVPANEGPAAETPVIFMPDMWLHRGLCSLDLEPPSAWVRAGTIVQGRPRRMQDLLRLRFQSSTNPCLLPAIGGFRISRSKSV